MTLAVEGFACLGSYGAGPNVLWSAMQADSPLAHPFQRTDTTALGDFFPPRALRQMDHFSRMSLLGCCFALQQAGIVTPGNMGIILATGFGPATPTFAFLESLLEFGESMASPLSFSHSVHNIPAASIAIKLALRGPCVTVCQPAGSLGIAFHLARNWLQTERVERVLLVAADELPHEMDEALLEIDALQGKNNDARSRRSEGCAVFCLAPDHSPSAKGCINFYSGHLPGKALLKNSAHLFLSGALLHDPAFSCTAWRGERCYGNLPAAMALDMAAALASEMPSLCLSAEITSLGMYLHTQAGISPARGL